MTLPDFDDSARELFLWSILMHRQEMAMLFLAEGKVTNALNNPNNSVRTKQYIPCLKVNVNVQY